MKAQDPKAFNPESIDYEEINKSKMQAQGMDPTFPFGTNHFRMGKAIIYNINQALAMGPQEYMLFITFTFGSLPVPWNERFRFATKAYSLAAKKFLPEIFEYHARVLDVHHDGRPHIHGIAKAHHSIREGFDPKAYAAFQRATYAAGAQQDAMSMDQCRALRNAVSTNPELHRIWQLMDDHLPAFGFGPFCTAFPVLSMPAPFRSASSNGKEGEEGDDS